MTGLLLPCTIAAQAGAATVTGANAAMPPKSFAVLPVQRLGADDMVEISVSHCAELNGSFRVAADGTLTLPLLQRPISVTGLLPSEVSQQLRSTLINENILVEPVVNVAVLEYRSRPVSVVGAVVHPLTFQAASRTTLLQAIAEAGGLTPVAGGDIIITKASPKGENVVRTVRVKELLAGVDKGDNLLLEGGEEIRIPEAGKIFVAGNVTHPGMYTMQSDADMTVMKAVSMSSGLASYSSSVAYIFHRPPAGVAHVDPQKVSLKRIMARQDNDPVLKADDILYVPSSDAKRITSKLITDITGFGQTAGGFWVGR